MKKIIYSISIALICMMIFSFGSTPNNNYVKYVDPFIGSGGHGHVFVGANVPFGGVQVGPTNFNKGWDWSSSYHHSDSIVKGFCHLNVSSHDFLGTTFSIRDYLTKPCVPKTASYT